MPDALPQTFTCFLSHSSADDALVARLSAALADLGADVTIDSRAFRGGDPLESVIFEAMAQSAGVLVLVTPAAFGSAWVGKELKHALALQQQRGGPRAFPVVPLLLDKTPLGAFGALFEAEPVHVAVQRERFEEALHPILVALGLRLPTELAATPQPAPEPVEELLLTLSEPHIATDDKGRRRAVAKARLVHLPSTAGQRPVNSQRFTLEAPWGVIEADDLRWYLEHYAVWPSPLLAGRALRIEGQLAHWGRLLHEAALPAAAVAEVVKSWATVTRGAARRFSVEVDAAPEPGAPDEPAQREAAALLLGLPWELLHEGARYLFQGAEPVRVRRCLPNEQVVPVPVLATPIRVLLVSPRPEEKGCGYIDHRASALPLVQAMEALAGQVQIQQLQPPTLPALREALDTARRAGQPIHVLHFDGHGVYQRHTCLGALCFEHPEDTHITQGPRRMALVDSNALGALLKDHGIPLVFLEACQTAQAENASESVASALLKTGVGSVVAMSHSVLVETSRRFVQAFYQALSQGQRVGSAMLAGQRELHDNPVRGRVFGVGDFSLQDWFVPVLFQDQADPQLFTHSPSAQSQEDHQARLRHHQGALPPPPPEGFVGRSRELLTLERLLHQAPQGQAYAVLRGQGGEGKTALAVEFARWRLRARQVQRVAFVSVEQHSHTQAVLDSLGQQLVSPGYSVTAYSNSDQALQPLERALREHGTLLVIDNLESVLAPPFAAGLPDAADEARAILALAQRLLRVGQTGIVFTSREALPAPFDGPQHLIELQRLETQDAVRLVECCLGLDAAGQGRAAEAQREDIEALVEAVHGHARTLSLLAPALRQRGPAATQAELVGLMAEMERRFPGQREHSLLASVELSLRRLSAEHRQQVRVLGVFQGGMSLIVLAAMMKWSATQAQALGQALVGTGLATPGQYIHLSLNPALCPYLAAELGHDERQDFEVRWVVAMHGFVQFLIQKQPTDAEQAAALALQELPNLMALLASVVSLEDSTATINLCAALHQLLLRLDCPRALTKLKEARDTAGQRLAKEPWSHARFEAERTRVEQLLVQSDVGQALPAALALHKQAVAAGDAAYKSAEYDVAGACFLLGRISHFAGQALAALPLLQEAQHRFEKMDRCLPGHGAAAMAAGCITEQADALSALNRFDEAAAAYEKAIDLAKDRRAERDLAVNVFQLGTVRMMQGHFGEALAAFDAARQQFAKLSERGSVATAWHQMGRVHEATGKSKAAEEAYRHSLAINVQLCEVAGQAGSLGQLGNLYKTALQQPEQAVIHYRQALERYQVLKDVLHQGATYTNLAEALCKLGLLDEARNAIEQGLAYKQGLGYDAKPWTSWAVLADIEIDAGNLAGAQAARHQAVEAFAAFKRDGGEHHNVRARLVADVGQLLLSGQTSQAQAVVTEWAQKPGLPQHAVALFQALQAVAAGARHSALATAPELHYIDAGELQLLLEHLNSAGR